jgi:predicted RNase H-like HicB family nuclease
VSEYLVIYEQSPAGWGAYCPDLPGLGAVAASREEVERLIKEAIDLHTGSLREHGDEIPPPTSAAGTISIGAA